MPNKCFHGFRLSEASEKYLQEYATKNGINMTAAIEKIIAEHRQYYDGFLEALSDKIMTRINAKYENLLTRVRLGANGADRNIQVVLEVLNTILYNSDMKDVEPVSTDVLKSPVLSSAEETVRKRIAAYREKKLDKEKRAQKRKEK